MSNYAKEAEKLERAYQRALKAKAKAEKELHQALQIDEVERRNRAISKQIEAIENILWKSYKINPENYYKRQTKELTYPEFKLSPNDANVPIKPLFEEYINRIEKPKPILRVFPFVKKKYDLKVEELRNQHSEDLKKYEKIIAERNRRITRLKEDYEIQKLRKLEESKLHNEKVALLLEA